MKWYVLTLFLVVGFVWSASAQPVDSKLVGNWESYDGPCSPCMLTVQENGTMSFNQAGFPLQLVFSQYTQGPGIDLVFPQGGKAELTLSKTGNALVGFYTKNTRTDTYAPVLFQRK